MASPADTAAAAARANAAIEKLLPATPDIKPDAKSGRGPFSPPLTSPQSKKAPSPAPPLPPPPGEPLPKGVPAGFRKVGTMDDPQGDPNDIRYGGNPDLDYVGSDYRYDIYVNPRVVKSLSDLRPSNAGSVVFTVAYDGFDETRPPWRARRNRDLTGLLITSDNEYGLSHAELYAALVDGRVKPAGLKGDEGPAVAAGGESKETGTLSQAPSTPEQKSDRVAPSTSKPDSDTGSRAGESGGGKPLDEKDNCGCHTARKLDYNCFAKTHANWSKVFESSDTWDRSIEKTSRGNLHKLRNKANNVSIEVLTRPDTFIDLDSSTNVLTITLRIGRGTTLSASGVDNPNGSAVWQQLKNRLKDVRVFLPGNDCGVIGGSLINTLFDSAISSR